MHATVLNALVFVPAALWSLVRSLRLLGPWSLHAIVLNSFPTRLMGRTPARHLVPTRVLVFVPFVGSQLPDPTRPARTLCGCNSCPMPSQVRER
jgi:hypothetical protein